MPEGKISKEYENHKQDWHNNVQTMNEKKCNIPKIFILYKHGIYSIN